MTEEKVGILLGGAPSREKLYDPKTGRALLMPVLPLNPPPPTSEDFKVGIIDSGVIAQHPQLRGLVIAEKAFAGTDPADRIGHGTAVALQFLRAYYEPGKDILGDKLSFPAIISANVVGPDGAPRLSAVINAIHWVIEQGAQAVSLSLGFLGSAKDYEELCQTIVSYEKVYFSAAAGNFGPDVPVYPAACEVSNLTAVGETHKGKRTETSGRGDVYAEGTVVLFPPWAYYLENGKRAARAGDLTAARRDFEHSLAEEENPEALFQLALLDLHEPQGNLEKSYQMLERAAELDPEQAIIHTHLGAVRMFQQRYAEAEGHLQKALALNPRDQMTLFNLGLTFLELQRPSEALFAFEKVRALNPAYPGIEVAIADAREESQMSSPSKKEK